MSKAAQTHEFPIGIAVRGSPPRVRRSIASAVIKRALDIVLASAGLLVLWPLMIAIAIAIRVGDGGPALFAQVRVGRNGRPFTCLKFRTMVMDAEKALAAHLASDPQARCEWETFQKLERDPRITGLGGFLRKTSLDELPQLFNILFGQMSVVGPRPIVHTEIERYGDSFVSCFSVRPGLTGLWQVSGRSDCSYQTRVALDQRYATTWTVLGDAEIILKTVPAVLTQKGSR